MAKWPAPKLPPTITVIFGTTLLATAFTIFAPALMMPVASASLPTMKPLTSCKKISGTRF